MASLAVLLVLWYNDSGDYMKKKLPILDAIRLLRNRRGWTQEDLARAIGMSVYTVNKWERQEFEPSRLARVFLDKLFAEEGIEVEKPIRKRD